MRCPKCFRRHPQAVPAEDSNRKTSSLKLTRPRDPGFLQLWNRPRGLREDVPVQRRVTQRIVEVAGAFIILSQPLIVELKEFKVRKFMTGEFKGRREREDRGRDVLPRVKCALQLPLCRIHQMRTRNLTLELASAFK